MSQQDPAVPNGNGSSVRTGLEAAIIAANTRHSGTADPTYKAAGMAWWRTDIPGTGVWTLYFYDGTSTIAVGTLDTTNHVFTSTAPLGDVSAGKLTADAFIGSTSSIVAVSGTTLTLTSAHNGKQLNFTNAGAVTVTVPTGLPTGFACSIVQVGAGQVTLAASGTTLNKRIGLKTAAQHAVIALLYEGSANTYVVSGDAAP